MKNQTRKAISMLLVLVQLFVLFPILQPQAEAAQSEPEVPVLNKTIVGTVQFQAFNFLGENTTGTGRNNYSDGKDYTSTFYYTDDYFASSAINANADETTELWSDLDNTKLAACSAAFALASFTTNIGNVTSNTEYSGKGTWENTNYANKDANVRSFLSQCEFPHVETFGLNEKPTIDSIGYTIGHKTIHVWDEESKTNKNYTLVAVGVRGAGYDSEWANNVTIGNPHSTSHEMPGGRHWGFDDAAKTVCTAIQLYLDRNGIAGDVKYWITGFSRAAAVANLAAGSISDSPSVYHTSAHQQYGNPDVYAYTLECPQAASVNEPALNYRNIHNIINPMDAVPKVSPDEFGHQRLGVDYQMPYYNNMPNQGTTSSDKALNKTYYERMQAVLGTIATAKKADGSADPVVTAVANYPYNTTVPVYTITGLKLISDAAGGNLMNNFGTEAVSARNVKIGNVYMDQFIDNLIDVFLTSKAWSGGTGQGARPTDNLNTFINEYQADFRALLGYLLDYSGPAYLGMVDELMDAVGDQIGSISLTNWWNNTGFALAFARFYLFNSGKDNLISQSQDMMVNIVNNMTADYPNSANGSGITRARMNTALRNAVKLVINLYAQEKTAYDSQYFGTSLHWLREILCTHMQETVLSWIMSLDSNHMNRSCRTITIPAGCDATVYEYRPEYAQYEGSMDDAEAKAPPVAELQNGALNSKDGRITLYQENGSNVIRYPASLQIRVDVKPNQTIHLNSIAVDDYETWNAYTAVSDGQNQFQNKPLYSTYTTITQQPGKTNAAAKNADLSGYGTIEPGDTLHVIVNDMQTFNSGDTVYELLVDKAPDVTVQDYAAGGGLTSGTDAASAVQLGGTASSSTDTIYRNIRTRQTTMTIPASSIYYDDELTTGSTSDYNGATTRLDWNAETQESVGKLFWYKFRGTRIDLYCTTDSTTGYVSAEIYENNGGAVGERVDIQAVKSSSDTTHYNVPTISFDGLDANKDYFLRLYAIKGANYRLDGIRVYHAADESDSAVRSAYETAGEQNAKYVNLRALLLGSVSENTLSADGNEGAVFYTDSGESYALTSSEYQNDSPKNEVYLKRGESVAFQIVGEYEKVAVGLSAPDSQNGSGRISVTNGESTKIQSINGALDQYYSVTPAPDGSVVIENSGSAMISITNVKLSGEYIPPAVAESVGPLRVSKSLMRYAADFAQLPETEEADPTPEPTPEATPEPTSAPNFGDMIRQLISSFVESLFGSISRLFGP